MNSLLVCLGCIYFELDGFPRSHWPERQTLASVSIPVGPVGYPVDPVWTEKLGFGVQINASLLFSLFDDMSSRLRLSVTAQGSVFRNQKFVVG